MKRPIKTIGIITIVGVMLAVPRLLSTTQPKETQATSVATVCTQKRIMSGTYYDYMVIETEDGYNWLLDDSEESPYIKDGNAIFEDGESVQVVFDTMGTKSIVDDVVLSIITQEEK